MSNYINVENRQRIITTNWVCENCPHWDMGATWHSFGACRAPLEMRHNVPYIGDAPATIAVYEDEETPICHRVASVTGYIVRRCEDDGRVHLRGDFALADDDYAYSRDYARNNFYYCEECGTWVTDYYDYDSDLHMCASCAREYRREQNRVIGDWHEHKGCFEIIRAGAYDTDDKTLGFEMEVEGPDRDHEDTAHEIIDAFGDTFVFEYDCSLEDGFEIISQPHTLQAFEMLDLNALEQLLIDNGYEYTDSYDTTGFHVHFSTAFLGDTYNKRVHTFARLVRFYDYNFDLLCDISERQSIGHSYRNADEHYCVDYDDDFELVDATVNGTRYVAVNGNRFQLGTFEIRLCDGTIRADKVRAWIDLNIALMECLQERPTLNILDVVPYMSDRAVEFFSLNNRY